MLVCMHHKPPGNAENRMLCQDSSAPTGTRAPHYHKGSPPTPQKAGGVHSNASFPLQDSPSSHQKTNKLFFFPGFQVLTLA